MSRPTELSRNEAEALVDLIESSQDAKYDHRLHDTAEHLRECFGMATRERELEAHKDW